MDTSSEQLALVRAAVRPTKASNSAGEAPTDPVAAVVLDVPLAHLDRLFDYAVPAKLDAAVRPGARVKVRFAGRDVHGFVVERKQSSEHPGPLTPIRRAVSAEPVLTGEVLAVAQAVARRYAGSVADVLRLAVPPRHARVEAADRPEPQPPWAPVVDPLSAAVGWSRVAGGDAFLRRLATADPPRAAWSTLPDDDWPAMVAAAAAAVLAGGRGSLLLVPDHRDVPAVDAAVGAVLGPARHVVLTADLGPAARYRAFLACLRGDVSVVVGTRAAAFAPVRNLGLVAIWDDGDDSYAEPRAPYPHAREVLRLRAQLQQTALLIASRAMSVDTAALVESGWVQRVAASSAVRRASYPQTNIAGESDTEADRDPAARFARVPRRVFEVVRAGLVTGPVLVHIPRVGYLPALACQQCATPARCDVCHGPLALDADGAVPTCRWCATPADPWRCSHCSGTRLRAPVIGAARTAEEWGRSFASTSIVSSTGDRLVETVDDKPAIVIATPGVEPVAARGYAAAVILDTWLTLARPSLRAGEEALRRWVGVASLVRPAAQGGRVIAVGDADSAVLQALVRSDPEGFAARELAARREARLPPAFVVATLTAPAAVLDGALAQLSSPVDMRVLGPVPAEDGDARIVLSVANEAGRELAGALKRMQSVRSARKMPNVRVQVGPGDL